MEHSLDLATATTSLELAPFGALILSARGHLLFCNATTATLFHLTHNPAPGTARHALPEKLRSALDHKETFIELTHATQTQRLKCWQHVVPESNVEIFFFLDVTAQSTVYREKEALEHELARLTTRDPLTGLPNRNALLQGLEPLVSRSRRYNNPLSLIHLELKLPEESEQRVLAHVSQLLRDQIRWADLVGRWDKSTFLLILPETLEEAAKSLVDKLEVKLREISNRENSESFHGAAFSFGIASWNSGDDTARLLQRAAQSALNPKRGVAA